MADTPARGHVVVPREFLDFLRNAPVSSGTCCCGDEMDKHADPMSSGHSPVDMWDHALGQWLKQIEAKDPLPFQVERAASHSIPIFNTGWNTWRINIVGAPKDERPFCEVSFQDANPKHPLYAEFMQGVQERVDHVVAVINAGLRAA